MRSAQRTKLIFAPGIVTGTSAPTSARVSVGGKSPLTGGIKESNAGAAWAPALADMQIKALIVEGQPQAKNQSGWLTSPGIETPSAPPCSSYPPMSFVGENLYSTFPKLEERFGTGSTSRASAWRGRIVTPTRAWCSMTSKAAPAATRVAAAWAP
jgi:hypothetical protein